jgi:thiamine monophosphate kinase
MRRFAAEWANPARLTRDNVTKDTLKPGDRVIVTGSPGRTASEYKLHLKRIVRPADGWSWIGGRR